MSPKLPRISGKAMLSFLEREGFALVRIHGSHHFLRRARARTCVPVHGNNPLRIGTLRSILRDIELSPEEFRKKLGQ